MSKTIRRPKKKSAPDVLDTVITELREDVDALTQVVASVQARLEKLEVVRAPSPTVEPDPQEPQRPETE